MKKNNFLTIFVTVLLTLSLVLGVGASTITYEGAAENFVVSPGTAYHSTDLFGGFKNVMPGDEITEIIEVRNDSDDSDYIKLYLRALPHDDAGERLEYDRAQAAADGKADETVVTMRDFLAQLTMTVSYVDETGRTVTLNALNPETVPPATEEKNDLTGDGVYLGSFRKGQKTELTVKLTVPIELGNEYANRVGEVDWIFTAEHHNDPQEIEPIRPIITVRKIWKDDGVGRPASIRVNLLRDGEVYDTVTLSDRNNWSYSWDKLDYRYKWSVEEDEVPEGYVATYKKNSSGWVTTITNTKILADKLTVEKVWDDGDSADRPDSVDVVLLCDGEYFDEVELNDRNSWTHTWENLSVNDSWSVVEKKVPEGYFVSYSYDEAEDKIIVTNTLEEPEPTELTVNKVWNDDGVNRPESITVYLLKDGELADSVEITEADNWTYTWEDLPAGYSWSVVEGETDGYTTEYKADGTEVTITNTKILAKEPYDLTVKKVWEDSGKRGRPESAEVMLYNGETVVEAVVLGEWNNWTHTWKSLDGDGNWQVIETNVPDGYTPFYEKDGNTVTVTNVESLLQTGQNDWLIPVLAGCGLLVIGVGVVLMFRKGKKNHA